MLNANSPIGRASEVEFPTKDKVIADFISSTNVSVRTALVE